MMNTSQPTASLAVVTGASSGLGAEIARSLARRGYHILGVARRVQRLEALGSELEGRHGIGFHALGVDLSQADAVDRIEQEVQRIGLPLSWLVNNAGYNLVARVDELPWIEHERFLRVLGTLPVELTHRLLPRLKRATPARILNIASVGAFMPGAPGSALYPGVKALVYRFTEGLAAELKGTGVTATASCPGYTDTEMLEKMGEGVDNAAFKKRFPIMPAATVAEQAVRAAEQGRIDIIHGRSNQAVALMFRLMPQALTRRFVSFIDTMRPQDAEAGKAGTP
jgi:short-subunit dehydrogenase